MTSTAPAVTAPSAAASAATAAATAGAPLSALRDLNAFLFRLLGQFPFRQFLGTGRTKFRERVAGCSSGLAWNGGSKRSGACDTEQAGQK
jgi:hypothetical protein